MQPSDLQPMYNQLEDIRELNRSITAGHLTVSQVPPSYCCWRSRCTFGTTGKAGVRRRRPYFGTRTSTSLRRSLRRSSSEARMDWYFSDNRAKLSP
jgi:hypothetical protein